jgi:hypothetical protein
MGLYRMPRVVPSRGPRYKFAVTPRKIRELYAWNYQGFWCFYFPFSMPEIIQEIPNQTFPNSASPLKYLDTIAKPIRKLAAE